MKEFEEILENENEVESKIDDEGFYPKKKFISKYVKLLNVLKIIQKYCIKITDYR